MADSIKVSVDADVCTGNGMCARIAPQIFELSPDTDIAQVLMPEVSDPELVTLAEEAEQSCPTLAIKVER
jgi:ferredoxin